MTQLERDRNFDKSWDDVLIELDNGVTARVNVSDSFWRRCPELRSADIGRWLLSSGVAPWLRGSPPGVVLTPMEPVCSEVAGTPLRVELTCYMASGSERSGEERLQALMHVIYEIDAMVRCAVNFYMWEAVSGRSLLTRPSEEVMGLQLRLPSTRAMTCSAPG